MALVNRYRIVTDAHSGFEVQVKYWYFPFAWLQISKRGGIGVNTNKTLEEAELLAAAHASGALTPPRQKRRVIKYLDKDS